VFDHDLYLLNLSPYLTEVMTLKTQSTTQDNELLLALVDGPFKRLRDDNHVDPYSILVWDRSRTPVIEAVEFLELLGRYPCGDCWNQWSSSDFVEILKEKHDLYRKSLASYAISDEDPEITPVCGTVVLIVSDQSRLPHRWLSLRALIEPGQLS
jgi:hypothetical protein